MYVMSHHIYKHIPISFDVITAWNQEVFFSSLCSYLPWEVMMIVVTRPSIIISMLQTGLEITFIPGVSK